MELLATNQPWNLIMFMAIPVILAETVAITELYILFKRSSAKTWVRKLSRYAGIVGGLYFIAVFVYLTKNAFIPLTVTGGWRGIGDFIAVSFYLLGVVPLGGIALLEMRIIGKNKSDEEILKIHATFVAIFLLVAHIAMIFGMLDPMILMGEQSHSVMSM
jgi:hypothetical protein